MSLLQLNDTDLFINGTNRSTYFVYSQENQTGPAVTNTDNEEGFLLALFRVAQLIVEYGMSGNAVLIMFGMGATLTWSQMKPYFWPPTGIAIGALGQYVVLPAITIGMTMAFDMDPYTAIGCLIVTSSPGGVYSTFCTYWMDGETGLSVIMTTCSTVLAFGAMPFNLWVYSPLIIGKNSDITIPFGSIMLGLTIALAPVIVGMIVRYFSDRLADLVTKVTSVCQVIIAVFVVISYVWVFWKVYYNASSLLYAMGITIPIIGFSLAYLLAFVFKQPPSICRTIGIETGCQNIPVATSIILLSFKDPQVRGRMLVFPSIYGLFMILEVFGGILLYQQIKLCVNKTTLILESQETAKPT